MKTMVKRTLVARLLAKFLSISHSEKFEDMGLVNKIHLVPTSAIDKDQASELSIDYFAWNLRNRSYCQ